ncbi:UNVERIFIED_CONTAM: hypothetical protein Sradi_4907500 [Sesamum radiatum]|uniref:Transmembrane protein n=1 Tax=Sesamum radiatum TaxID=300843 RepID=A0AAW2MDW9_SESRA
MISSNRWRFLHISGDFFGLSFLSAQLVASRLFAILWGSLPWSFRGRRGFAVSGRHGCWLLDRWILVAGGRIGVGFWLLVLSSDLRLIYRTWVSAIVACRCGSRCRLVGWSAVSPSAVAVSQSLYAVTMLDFAIAGGGCRRGSGGWLCLCIVGESLLEVGGLLALGFSQPSSPSLSKSAIVADWAGA